MSILLPLLLLILGFALLIKGADFLVDGASALALRFHITPIVIGLTVVSFGTSSPELIVNVLAAAQGNSALSFGNIVGSNIINILLILGVASLIRPLHTQHNTVWREIPFSLLAVLVLFSLANDGLFAGLPSSIARNDGLVLLLFFVIFMAYTFGISKVSTQDSVAVPEMSSPKMTLYMVIGLLGLILGGKFVVDNAMALAKMIGLSDKVIGLTVVAIGTSLPELFTSAVAAAKGKMDIAVGNVVGSNIFNIFWILGLTSLIRPVVFDASMNVDVAVLTIASLLLFFTMFTGKRRLIDRWEAVIFLLLYVAYTIYLVI